MKLSFRIVAAFYFLFFASLANGSTEGSFETLKSLNGTWAIQSDGKPIRVEMTYDLGSKNSIVTEPSGKELSVFYRDGNDLLMTHFCNAGNQPRLRLNSRVKKGTLEFEIQ
jgi:hypothetical protein